MTFKLLLYLILCMPSFAMAATCKDLTFVTYAHLGNFHVQPMQDVRIRLKWFDGKTWNENLLADEKTDIEGRLKVNKGKISEFRKYVSDHSGSGIYINLDFKNSLKDSTYLSPSNKSRTFYRFLSVSESVISELTSPEFCETIVLTENNRFLSGGPEELRSSLIALWAFREVERFLYQVQPPQLDRKPKPIEVSFDPRWDGGRFKSLKGDFDKILIGLQSNSLAFMTMHEIGHALARHFLNLKMRGGSHTDETCHSTDLALSEGWASFVALTVLDGLDAHFSLGDRVNYSDFMVFAEYPRNYEIPDAPFYPNFSNGMKACNTIENEYVVYKLLFAIYKDIGISFSDIWSAMQTDGKSSVRGSVLEVVDVLNARFPDKKARIQQVLTDITGH